MNNQNLEALARAEFLADSLRSLATEYQAVVRSTNESDPAGKTARRSLDRKLQRLKPREVIHALSVDGLSDLGEKLDDLSSAAAMVFNLAAVSIGVNEAEVLDIDIDGPHAAVIEALTRTSKI